MNHWANFVFASFLMVGSLAAEPFSPADVRGRTAKNVLRAHLGVTGGTGPSCPLLKDDPTVPLRLSTGDFTIYFDLNDLHIVSELAFMNEDTSGRVKCSVSTDRQAWVEVVAAHLIPSSRESTIRFVGSEARFIRLDFSVAEPGNLYCLGLFGLTVAADYDFREMRAADDIIQPPVKPDIGDLREPLSEEVDGISLTITPSGARVPWISSLAIANPAEAEALQLIDENAFTRCEFSPDDPNPSVLVDLQGLPMVERVGILYAQQPGALRLRLLQTAEQSIGNRTGAVDSDSATAVREFVFEDTQGVGRFAFTRLATTSRYLELSWTPHLPTDSTDAVAPAPKPVPFAIHELAVFSRERRSYVEQAPQRRAVSQRVHNTVVQSLIMTMVESNVPQALAAEVPGALPAAAAASASVPTQPAAPDFGLDPVSF